MKVSESIISNLLIELDSLNYRQRSIRKCFKNTYNTKLKDRLIIENMFIFERIKQIYNISLLLNQRDNEKINFAKLLAEVTKRSLSENREQSHLFNS